MKSRASKWIFEMLSLAAVPLLIPVCAQELQNQTSTFTVLYAFPTVLRGSDPGVSFRDGAGNLYGTTSRGGSSSKVLGCQGQGCGTIFKLDTMGNETVLHNFTGADGWDPSISLRDSAGNLYGTAFLGGSPACGGSGHGVIFKVGTNGAVTTLYRFAGSAGGWYPSGSLTRDSAGNLYGMTVAGGDLACNGIEGSGTGCGVVFKLSTTGKETVLYTFTGVNGASPGGGLLRDAAGNLYGTTFVGGSKGRGVIFKLDTTGKETVLHDFTGADGSYPTSLLRDGTGNLYGATNMGGGSNTCSGGCGVVFKLDTTGKETVLHTFTGPDGSHAWGGMLRDTAGNLYGTTGSGGDLACPHLGGCGVVFKLDTSDKETVLHSFTGGADGWYPVAGLIQDAAGNLYGTTSYGGVLTCPSSVNATGCGVIFRLAP
jgi:uncharacterized repeat protein (TIGR03803 family)